MRKIFRTKKVKLIVDHWDWKIGEQAIIKEWFGRPTINHSEQYYIEPINGEKKEYNIVYDYMIEEIK
jgi:hypothetical protein